MVPPRLTQVVVVEPQRGPDRRPEAFDVRLSEDLAGPPRVRCGHDGPGEPAAEEVPPHLGDEGQVDYRHPSRVQAVEEVGLRAAGQADVCAAVGDEVGELLVLPGLVRAEDVVRRVGDRGSADVVVVVADDDARGSGTVCLFRHRTGELGMLDDAAHVHRLAGLEIDSHANDELGVAVEPARGYRVDSHPRQATPPTGPVR